jgi:hypothetical protein
MFHGRSWLLSTIMPIWNYTTNRTLPVPNFRLQFVIEICGILSADLTALNHVVSGLKLSQHMPVVERKRYMTQFVSRLTSIGIFAHQALESEIELP